MLPSQCSNQVDAVNKPQRRSTRDRSRPRYGRSSPLSGKGKEITRQRDGCLTCRVRGKGCKDRWSMSGQRPPVACHTCERLAIECLGYGKKRPDWMKAPGILEKMRQCIKAFLADRKKNPQQQNTLDFKSFYAASGSQWKAPFPCPSVPLLPPSYLSGGALTSNNSSISSDTKMSSRGGSPGSCLVIEVADQSPSFLHLASDTIGQTDVGSNSKDLLLFSVFSDLTINGEPSVEFVGAPTNLGSTGATPCELQPRRVARFEVPHQSFSEAQDLGFDYYNSQLYILANITSHPHPSNPLHKFNLDPSLFQLPSSSLIDEAERNV